MTVTITPNPEYTLMIPHVLQVRDAVSGSPFIKAKRETYLPHPSSVDKNSPEQLARYNHYLGGAEFDEFTQYTKRAMLGKLKLDDLSFDPDNQLSYLNEDVDNDGLSMKGLVESCCGNVLEVKWHLLLADYKGLSDLGIDEISAQDIQDANPRATIKQYPRESVVDWDYERVNGRMMLTYLLLRECGEVVDQDSGSRQEVTSYLKLGIDETGYYQQKRADGTYGASSDYGEKSYVSVGGSVLQFIPVTIACDEEFAPGTMPKELGYLAPIAELALARYRVSAKYKEAMNALIPTLHVTGVDASDWETFSEVNGRNYVASGAFSPNIWPNENTEFSLLEASGSLQQFVDYFEDNKNKVRALGGVFKTNQDTQRTATEVMVEADNATSTLLPIANSVESAIKWQIGYCAMFEGMANPDNVGDYVQDLDFTMNKDFGVAKLTVEEIKALIELYMNALLPKEEVIRLIEMGGWTISSFDELVNGLSEGM